MAPLQYDFVIVGGGSAGSALANRLSADPANRVLVLEAGRSDYPWDVFIHMPAALTYPIGSRFYDWKYESEPEPHMGGRRVYHARGKVLGGSSSINGMIFQRGNPMDYERWAADPGMETWDYAHCLPYFRRMENCLAADPDDEFRGHDGPLVLERGPATNPLFGAFLEATQEAGYAPTDDVNGFRQEGSPSSTATSTADAACRPRRRTSSPPGSGPTSRSGPAPSSRGCSSRASGPSASSTGAARAHPSGSAPPKSSSAAARSTPAAAPALRRRQRGGAERPRHRRRPRPSGRRREHAGPPGGLRPVRL